MTLHCSSLLRHGARLGLVALALGLAACVMEPRSFWTDVTKEELDLVVVPSPPVPVRRGHKTGLNVPYLAGYVRSPYTHPPRLVDVRGLQAGSLVWCPFTQRPFYLPEDFTSAPLRGRYLASR